MIKEHNVDNNFLDISTVEEGNTMSRIGYLADVKVKPNNNGQDYGVCKIKDVNGNFITGFFFDLDSEQKINLLALKRKAISMIFIGSHYNGKKTINLSSISHYTGEFPYNKFIGEVDNIDKIFNNVENIFKSKLKGDDIGLPQSYKCSSLSNIYGGKVGGYVKFLESMLYRLVSLVNVDSIDVTRLIEILYKVQGVFYNYLNRVNTLEIIPMKEKMEFMLKAYNLEDNEACEVLGGLICDMEPETIYGILIYSEMVRVLDILNLSPICSSMIIGGSYKTKIGDKEWNMVKY